MKMHNTFRKIIAAKETEDFDHYIHLNGSCAKKGMMFLYESKNNCNMERLPEVRKALEDKRRKGDRKATESDARKPITGTNSSNSSQPDGANHTRTGRRCHEANLPTSRRKITGHTQLQCPLRFLVNKT
jgi:hypothetical protein